MPNNPFHMMEILFIWSILISCASADDDTNRPTETHFRDVSSTHLISTATSQNSMDGEAVDIDEDGDMDIIIACEFCPNILLINDGTGVLTDESDNRLPRTNHDSEDIAVADFDHDGDLDIIFVSEDDQVNEYFENTGNDRFEVGDPFPLNGTSNAIQTTDLNQDGYPDLIIGNAGQNYILINKSGVFEDETQSRLPVNSFTTQDLALADIDQDGDPDLIEANETFNRVLINDGNGIFTYEEARLPHVDDQTRDVEVGDVDGDGDLDIFFSNVDFGGIGDPQNRLLLNDGLGFFSEATSLLPLSDFRTVDANFSDLDMDGDLDLIVGNRFNGQVMMTLINGDDSQFTDETGNWIPEMEVYTFDFQEADFNGDGKIDLYLCNFRGQDRLLFRE